VPGSTADPSRADRPAHGRRPIRSVAVPLVVLVLVFATATAVAWFRLDPVQRATLWAEDGRDFVSEDMVDGLGATLFRPFGGYLQVVPRLVAALSSTIAGPEHLAQTVTLLSCAVVGAVSALLYRYGRAMLRTPVAPFLLAAVPPLIPTAPREALGTMNNLHSFLLLLVPFVLLAVPRSWWSSAATAVLVAVVVLSETQALLFAPLVLAGIRRRQKWPVAAAFLLAGAAQVVTAAQHPRPSVSYGTATPVTLADVVVGFVTVPLTTVWTTRLGSVGDLISASGMTPIVVLTVVCVVVAAAGIVCGGAVHRWLLPATVLGASALWAAALLVTPAGAFAFTRGVADHVAHFGTIRYATVSSGFLLLALVVTADALWSVSRSRAGGVRPGAGRGRGRGWTWVRRSAAVAVALAVVVPLVGNVRDSGHASRADGPTITSQVPAARVACAARGTDGRETVLLRQSPDRSPWAVTLTCEYLQRR
jgi:hypothetical protein